VLSIVPVRQEQTLIRARSVFVALASRDFVAVRLAFAPAELPLLQDDSIQEVEMEDTPAESAKEPEPEPPGEEESAVSKWEKMDPSEERLDKLDGVMHARKRKETQPQTMEDYLQLPDDYASRTTGSGNKKRVRWADLEEEMQQRKMRDVGFVVGQTDWSRMTDPTKGQSALTQTKYIPKVRSKK